MNRMQAELGSLRHRQQLLGIMVFSLVTIMVWVAIGLITSQTDRKISSQQQKLAEPLNPTINLEVIEDIENKRGYSDEELARFPIYTLRLQGTQPRPATTPQPLPETTSDVNAENAVVDPNATVTETTLTETSSETIEVTPSPTPTPELTPTPAPTPAL